MFRRDANKSDMKMLDMFAGIGGFRMSFAKYGFECAGYIEIDKFARKSYEAIYDTKKEYTARDIREVQPEELPEAEIYTAGFPCQSFSIAGKRGGFEDTRGTLFFEIARLAKERQPKYLVLENVKGLLSHDGGKTFGTILNTLSELGYSIEWQVFNSKNFGVPQNRERVFIIGHPGNGGGRKIFPIFRETKANVTQVSKGDGITYCIDANYGKGLGPSQINKGKRTQIIDDGRFRKLTPKECWRLQGFPDWAFKKAQKVNSDTQLYRQAGNSVTIPVVETIGRRLKNVQEKNDS